MTDEKSDLNEIKDLVAKIHAELATDAKELMWGRISSITIVLIAVIAAFGSQLAGRFGENVLSSLNDAMLQQGQVTNQWGYFQSKSIKQHMFEISLAELGETDSELAKTHIAEIERYDIEKKEIMASARAAETKRDAFRAVGAIWSEKARACGLAVTILSIAIAVGSVCLLVRKRWLYILSVLLALAGAVQLYYGWKLIEVTGPAVL